MSFNTIGDKAGQMLLDMHAARKEKGMAVALGGGIGRWYCGGGVT